jgi:hypothetical protein
LRRVISLGLLLVLGRPVLAAGSKEFDEHKKKAQIHYELAEYGKAIDEYKAAYAISQESWILYNIAQAYRLSHDCQLAARFYKNYVVAVQKGKDPAPERTKHAQEQLPLMEKCAAEKASAPATTPPGPSTPDDRGPAGEPSPSSTPSDGTTEPTAPAAAGTIPEGPSEGQPRPGRWKRISGLSLLGAAVVAAGVGVVFNLQARDKEQALDEKFSPENPMPWTAEDEALKKDMEREKTRAVVLYLVGGACLAGGGVLTYLGFTERAPEAIAVMPLQGGAEIAASFRF